MRQWFELMNYGGREYKEIKGARLSHRGHIFWWVVLDNYNSVVWGSFENARGFPKGLRYCPTLKNVTHFCSAGQSLPRITVDEYRRTDIKKATNAFALMARY